MDMKERIEEKLKEINKHGMYLKLTKTEDAIIISPGYKGRMFRSEVEVYKYLLGYLDCIVHSRQSTMRVG